MTRLSPELEGAGLELAGARATYDAVDQDSDRLDALIIFTSDEALNDAIDRALRYAALWNRQEDPSLSDWPWRMWRQLLCLRLRRESSSLPSLESNSEEERCP